MYWIMNRLRTIVYRKGFRPKFGSVLYSPSADIQYAWIDYIAQLNKEQNSGN